MRNFDPTVKWDSLTQIEKIDAVIELIDSEWGSNRPEDVAAAGERYKRLIADGHYKISYIYNGKYDTTTKS